VLVMDELVNKVAVVTGAASGIGKGAALAFARAGMRVVIADIDSAAAERVADAARELGVEAIGVTCDVGSTESFTSLRDLVLDRFGRVDVIMNNAGVILSGLPDEIPLAEWERVLNVNLMSVVRSNHLFLPVLLRQGSGHIVNTASFAGLFTYSYDRLPYAASKAAIVQISEGLALYLRPKGIGVTCLCPGPVKTNIMASSKAWSGGLDIRGPGPEFGLLEPDAVGDMVVDAVRKNTFLLPTHPAVLPKLVARASDWDAFLDRQVREPHIIIKGSRGDSNVIEIRKSGVFGD
jgi:NAD(P)-dependent dehydrogenase (short-subunit alcohol dehydrogenase family)